MKRMESNVVHELLDLVLAVQENGHFAELICSDYGYPVSIFVRLNGFESRVKGYDYTWLFLPDLPDYKYKLENCKKILKLLAEKRDEYEAV